jgi:hypothetical protein
MRRSVLTLGAVLLLAGAALAVELRTDTSRVLVPLDEIVPGGPPPDGIPAIDRPRFVAPTAASAWLRSREPMLAGCGANACGVFPTSMPSGSPGRRSIPPRRSWKSREHPAGRGGRARA